MATLNPKVQAWKDKYTKEFADLQTKHRTAEQADWEANKSTYEAQGYHREEDPNNYWGSKWSYKGNSNNEGGNRGGNGNEGKVDLSGLGLGTGTGTGTGTASGGLNFSMQNLSTIGDRTNFTHDPYFGLFNKGSNPLSTPELKTSSRQTSAAVEENSSNLPIAFKYRFKTVDAEGNRLGGTQYAADPSKYNIINVSGNPDIEDEYGNTWAKVNDSDKYALLRLGQNYSGPLKVGTLRNGKYEQRNVSVSYPNGYTGTVNKNQFVTFDKQGGTMNRVKYFKGGAPIQTTQNQMSPEQEIQAAVKFLQAVQAGDKKAVTSLQQIQQAAQQGVPEAQRMMKVLEQASKMLKSAKWGSKLQYIRSLKFAKGGKTCPDCEQQKIEMKKCGGKKAKKHYFGGWL